MSLPLTPSTLGAQADAALLRLAALVDSAEDAIIGQDLNGLVTSWNHGAENIFGYAANEAVGTAMRQLLPADRLDEEKQVMEKVRHGEGVKDLVTQRLHKDGRCLTVSVTTSPIKDAAGQFVGSSLMARDITARQDVEESLRLLSSAVEHAKEAIMVTEADLDFPGPRIVFVNPAFSQMTGYSAAESLGQTPRLLQGPRTDKAVLRRLRQNLEHGEMFAGETVNYRKDGSEYDLEWQIAPIRNPAGKITHFVAVQRDVTQRNCATRELETTVRQLFNANAAKDRILAVTTHDLRSPLSAVWGLAGFLRDGTLGPVNAEQVENLDLMIGSLEAMLALVNDLLDVATLDDKSMRIDRRPLDLAPLLAQAGAAYTLIAAQKKQRLRLEVAATPLKMEGDEIRLKRVLENLILNAIKFSPLNSLISVGARAEGEFITVWVDDEGPGVPEAEQAKLFTDYGRTSNRPTGGESSTGLGLAICRRIIHAHGGSITMRNRAAGGAHFEFTLPRTGLPQRAESQVA